MILSSQFLLPPLLGGPAHGGQVLAAQVRLVLELRLEHFIRLQVLLLEEIHHVDFAGVVAV